MGVIVIEVCVTDADLMCVNCCPLDLKCGGGAVLDTDLLPLVERHLDLSKTALRKDHVYT